MTLQEFMNTGRDQRTTILGDLTMLEPTPRVVCADGFSISVQAGEYNYCIPRTHCRDAGDYTSMELGFPSELDGLIEPFAEDEGTVHTVFPYTPIEVIEQLIEKHGGIAEQ